GVAVGHTNSTIAVDTTAKVDDNTAILAGGAVIVAAEMKTNQSTNTDATGIGLGGDANADAHSTLSGTTEVDGGTAAKVEGRIVVLSVTDGDSKATGDNNDNPLMTVKAISEGDGGGLVAVGTASSTVNVNIPFKIQVNGAAAITGWEGVDFRTSYQAIDTEAHAESSATGLFGGVHSSSDNTTTLDSTVKGLAGAVVTATPRVTGTFADPALLSPPGSTPKLAFDIDMTNQPQGTLDGSNGTMRIISENPDHVRALGFSLSGDPDKTVEIKPQ